MTYRCECSHSGSDKVGINVLRFVDLSPIITCLTIKCSYPLQPGGRRSVGYIAGHFQGFVCAGQTQAVHWICLGCFTRRHVEESWVEETRLVNKAAKRGMTCVSDFSSRVIVGVHVKPIFGYLWREESVAIVEAERDTIPSCEHPTLLQANPKTFHGRPHWGTCPPYQRWQALVSLTFLADRQRLKAPRIIWPPDLHVESP